MLTHPGSSVFANEISVGSSTFLPMQKSSKMVYATDVLANLPSALRKWVKSMEGCENNDDYCKYVQ
jgi:hypothetical protein